MAALETGDFLPLVATKNLVERGSLLTVVVQSLNGSGRCSRTLDGHECRGTDWAAAVKLGEGAGFHS